MRISPAFLPSRTITIQRHASHTTWIRRHFRQQHMSCIPLTFIRHLYNIPLHSVSKEKQFSIYLIFLIAFHYTSFQSLSNQRYHFVNILIPYLQATPILIPISENTIVKFFTNICRIHIAKGRGSRGIRGKKNVIEYNGEEGNWRELKGADSVLTKLNMRKCQLKLSWGGIYEYLMFWSWLSLVSTYMYSKKWIQMKINTFFHVHTITKHMFTFQLLFIDFVALSARVTCWKVWWNDEDSLIIRLSAWKYLCWWIFLFAWSSIVSSWTASHHSLSYYFVFLALIIHNVWNVHKQSM